MKIKNIRRIKDIHQIKRYITMLTLTLGVSVLGCNGQNCYAMNNDVKNSIDIGKEIANDLFTREKWENFAAKIGENEGMYVDYSFSDYNVCIYNKNDYEGKKELSTDFYTNLNILLENNNITRLYICNVDDRFDFSKVNLSNIKELALSLKNYEGTLPPSIFNYTFNELYFYNTSLEVATELMKNCVSKNTCVDWYEEIENQSHLKTLLEILVQDKVEMKSFEIWQINKQNYSGITNDELTLLGKIPTTLLDLTIDGISKPIDLNVKLNEETEMFLFSPYKNYDRDINGELGNIKINSDNKKLECYFNHVDITSNTSFSMPDVSSVNIGRLNINNTKSIQSLKNVQHLVIGDSFSPGMDSDILGYVEYKKEGEWRTDPFRNNITHFTDFQEMIAYLNSYAQLLKVKEKLMVSPNEEKYYKDIISIGDIVNLNSNNDVVFANPNNLQNQENGHSSYYGTSELRCVSSLVLTNGEKNVEVYNMDDYEYYIDKGYVVFGSNLVNQYSLNFDGKLNYEGCYDNASLHLVRIPFK